MILTKLKQKTLWHHQQMEKKLDLFHSIHTLEDYRYLLGKLLGFYEPAEAALEAVLDWSLMEFDFRARKKTPLLLRDLHALGIADTLLLPRCRLKLRLDTLQQALGCLYVFESATLNAQILLRHFNHTLGVTPERGGAFFNSYGDRVMAMWRDFGLQLNACAFQPDIEEAIIRAAVDTYIHFDHWFCGKSSAIPQSKTQTERDDNAYPARLRAVS